MLTDDVANEIYRSSAPQVEDRPRRLTAKEYFDLLEKTSLEGGFPASDGKGNCLYRAPKGKACAIGIILPDQYYLNKCNGSIFEICMKQLQVNEWLPVGLDYKDLIQVQKLHDDQGVNIYYRNEKWNHDKFMNELRQLKCFQGF